VLYSSKNLEIITEEPWDITSAQRCLNPITNAGASAVALNVADGPGILFRCPGTIGGTVALQK
jgi:hypothetical protein